MRDDTVMPGLTRHPRGPRVTARGDNGYINSLELSVYDTIRFFDLYDMPVTATQIWQHLVVAKSGYAHQASLREVQQLIATSDFLHEKTETKWGYSTLRGRLLLVGKRLRRHAIAQDKWKIVKRCAPFLAVVPFVRALAGSGSLAVDNTKYSSDLDVFVIVQDGRIWTARLLLLMVSSVLGRRRVYGDQHAPDMLCLNHYITDASLGISSDIQNVCMAIQYACLVPIFEDSLIRKFHQRNSPWAGRFVSTAIRPHAQHCYTISLHGAVLFLKEQFEKILLEPIGDSFERFAELLQRTIISRHRSPRGRIVLAYHELAFHPDTKVPALVQAFQKNS